MLMACSERAEAEFDEVLVHRGIASRGALSFFKHMRDDHREGALGERIYENKALLVTRSILRLSDGTYCT